MPEAILGAAAHLFASKGFDAASVREIAEAAGVTKPTIYYYFENKEGLLEAVLDAAFGPLVKRLAAINARESDADPAGRIKEAVAVVFEYAVERGDLARFAYGCVYGPRDQPAAGIILEDFSEVLDQLTLTIERAIGAGIIRPECRDDAVRALRGIMDVRISDHLLNLDELDPEDAGKVVKGLLEGYGR